MKRRAHTPMMRIDRRRALLPMLALLGLMALPVVHSLVHPVLGHAHHPCLVCGHGQARQPALATALPTLQLPALALAPPRPRLYVAIPAPVPTPRGRAPPAVV